MADTTFRTVLPALKAIDNGDGTYSMGVKVQGLVNFPTGRTATYVVAASNAPAHVKAQADYTMPLATTDLGAIVNAAYALGYKDVQITEGNFALATSIQMIENSVFSGRGISSIITLANGANCDGITVTAGTGNYVIQSLMLVGNKANNASGNAIDFTNTYNMRFRDLHIASWKENGLYALNTAAYPLYFFDTVYSYANDGSGFYLDGGAGLGSVGLFATKLAVGSNGSTGIVIKDIGDIHLSQSMADSNGTGAGTAGVHLLTVGNGVLDNMYVGGNNTDGIHVQTSHDIVISNSTIEENRNPGVGGGTGVKIFADSYRVSVLGNRIKEQHELSDLGVWIVTGATDITVSNNTFYLPLAGASSIFLQSVTSLGVIISHNNFVAGTPQFTPAPDSIIQGNSGWIHPSEVRAVSGSLTAGIANAIAFAWHNPEGQEIFIKKVVVEITTGSVTANSVIDVGIADDAAGTNRGTEFFNDLDANDVDINDSWVVGDGGTQTKFVFCQDSASATDGWVVGQILVADAAALVGKYYIEYVGR